VDWLFSSGAWNPNLNTKYQYYFLLKNSVQSADFLYTLLYVCSAGLPTVCVFGCLLPISAFQTTKKNRKKNRDLHYLFRREIIDGNYYLCTAAVLKCQSVFKRDHFC